MIKNCNDLGLLILRLGFSGMMLVHGIPKLSMLSDSSNFINFLGMGTLLTLILTLIGEVLTPIMIIAGFQTKIASAVAAITMAGAAFVVHAGDSFDNKEKALLYLVGFLAIAFTGAGRYAIDALKK